MTERYTAYHEAGHAVARFALGLRIDREILWYLIAAEVLERRILSSAATYRGAGYRQVLFDKACRWDDRA